MRRYLSFDCAIKTLAFTFLEVDEAITIEEIEDYLAEKAAEKSKKESFHGTLRLIKCGVIDICHGLSTSDIDEAYKFICLRRVLDNLPVDLDAARGDRVLIEEQPKGLHGKSVDIQSALIMYYAQYDVRLVNPNLKNKITVAEHLKYSKFTQKYSSLYDANKAHSEANFLYLTHYWPMKNALIGCPVSCYDDLADSFLQILAFCFIKAKK